MHAYSDVSDATEWLEGTLQPSVRKRNLTVVDMGMNPPQSRGSSVAWSITVHRSSARGPAAQRSQFT